MLAHVWELSWYSVLASQASVLATHTGVLPEVNSPVDPLISVKLTAHVPDPGVVADSFHTNP